MKFLSLTSTNAYYNLAFEEYILKNFQDDVFLLWQNDNTIVVGRNQNTMEEINADYVKENGITVVRRMSGGGAVYHDLGNLNYSFALNHQGEDYFDFATFTKPVIDLLESLGVKAELSGRNDLVIDGKKFSGNAQYAWHDRILHHGTLLFDSDSSKIANALRVSQQKIESKGIKSIKSRVTNIGDHLPQKMNIEEFRQKFIELIMKQNPNLEVYTPEGEVLDGVDELYLQKYSTWEWNFGYSPDYTFSNAQKFDAGSVRVELNVTDNGVIESAKFYGDFFSKENVEDIENALIGTRHEERAIHEVLNQFQIEDYFHGIVKENLLKLMF